LELFILSNAEGGNPETHEVNGALMPDVVEKREKGSKPRRTFILSIVNFPTYFSRATPPATHVISHEMVLKHAGKPEQYVHKSL
jgi:hypothetical protein